MIKPSNRNEESVIHLETQYSCHGHDSGFTFPCSCSTGMTNMYGNDFDLTSDRDGIERIGKTLVFNQCPKSRRNGALYGTHRVTIRSKEHGDMGMAVYSAHLNICGGKEDQCFCTCFDQDAVEGAAGFRTSISKESHGQDDEKLQGYVTDCLGLCGPNCQQGKGGTRFASILIHDVCQSFIRNDDPMPNQNICSDEGWRAFSAAIMSIFTNGFCQIRRK